MTDRRMLFVRDFVAYSGGHGKVFDWFRHIENHPDWTCSVWLTPRSRRTSDNPWVAAGIETLSDDRCPVEAFDALFLAGLDWNWAEPIQGQPVINLIQSMRHADSHDPRYPFLSRPAIRIAVSKEIARAITNVGCASSSVIVIPAAVDVPELQATAARARAVPGHSPILVDATKDIALGLEVTDLLRRAGVACNCLVEPLPREEYLRQLARATVAVVLPAMTEGFYLPALEAMAMGVPVVSCDAGGNREYLRPDVNALVAAREPQALANAAAMLADCKSLCGSLVGAGVATAARFDLPNERHLVHKMLDRILSIEDVPQPCHKSASSH